MLLKECHSVGTILKLVEWRRNDTLTRKGRVKRMCVKRKLDKIRAMLIVAGSLNSKNKNRQECRYYWCGNCRAYHTTSQPK